MRRANQNDIPVLVQLMAEFYAESNYELDRSHAEKAFDAILADERLGVVWLIETNEEIAGHLVLTFRFGMEYGGLIACLDDLFVRKQFRNQGLSSAAVAEAREYCASKSVRALTVEVAHDNKPAQKVYRRAGFTTLDDRQMLALSLALPTHHV